ncbi:Aste57867_25429 [Aphanomyces stellatus]|uniref:Aste57867_25429 protein n=1 Tax=Aphanomyces stellatus TaxID=120398 RepID=A0A485LXW7_9STRA|nr:hypothetical protein As57867_025350 [Aphanomyces stellatus]VFU02053.1 Aste57867_25429 [Aphanomyces stellatus]
MAGKDEVEVTLAEVLEEDASLVETADAVLGEASATHCSFPDGYIRQALYSCLTCQTSTKADAGLCLACSLTCHADHELVELYTKRHFRCDCGNEKFANATSCKLYEGKDRVNAENVYSQNFKGLYCACHRPYPDPDRTTPEVMIQCIICEDWLHEEHLYADSTTAPPNADHDFDEMICRACMSTHAFLYQYVDMPESDDEITCPLAESDPVPPSPPTPTFWTQGWRATLCKCDACLARYASLKCDFLLDEADSLLAYEEAARANQEDAAAAGENAFKRELTHEQQVEMALGYEHMASSLKEYLSGFAASGQTVKAEDIQGFFETLRATKRQKRE